MTEKERPWYQDGLTVGVIAMAVICIGLPLYVQYQEEQKPIAIPMLSGRIDYPFLGNPVWKVSAWHQCPATLRNGTLSVTVESELLANGDARQYEIYSFESWSPNEDHAVEFDFPLHTFDPKQDIPITVTLSAKNAKSFVYRDAWLGNTWKSNQD